MILQKTARTAEEYEKGNLKLGILYSFCCHGTETYVIITFVGQRTRVDGRSMMNTLSDGDNLIVEKLSYRFGDPERFDIIVFRPYEMKEYYIKRIIGLRRARRFRSMKTEKFTSTEKCWRRITVRRQSAVPEELRSRSRLVRMSIL